MIHEIKTEVHHNSKTYAKDTALFSLINQQFIKENKADIFCICLNYGGPLLIVINEDKLFSIIDKRKPRTVALNGPDGLASKIYDCALKISERYKIPAYIIGDSSWGSCDLNFHAAEVLGVDILFNIGHTISLENFGEKVVMIDAYDDIDFTNVAQICARQLKEKGFKAVSLVTFSQHLKAITYVRGVS